MVGEDDPELPRSDLPLLRTPGPEEDEALEPEEGQFDSSPTTRRKTQRTSESAALSSQTLKHHLKMSPLAAFGEDKTLQFSSNRKCRKQRCAARHDISLNRIVDQSRSGVLLLHIL